MVVTRQTGIVIGIHREHDPRRRLFNVAKSTRTDSSPFRRLAARAERFVAAEGQRSLTVRQESEEFDRSTHSSAVDHEMRWSDKGSFVT